MENYSYTDIYYNKDNITTHHNSNQTYQSLYQPGHSRFTVCDVGVELGSVKYNLRDAKEAEVDCADMDLVKCVFLCMADEGCGSVFYFQEPLATTLDQPRYLCSLMRGAVEGLDGFSELEEYECRDKSECECEGGGSVCKVREFLNTRQSDEERLPLTRRSGSRLVYKQHLGLENIGLEFESKFLFCDLFGYLFCDLMKGISLTLKYIHFLGLNQRNLLKWVINVKSVSIRVHTF